MNFYLVALTCVLGLSSSSCVSTHQQSDAKPVAARPQAAVPTHAQMQIQVEGVTDVNKFLAETDESLKLARSGVYGKLKPGDMDRLEAARDSIKALLDGHASAQELGPEDRVALYQAQDVISSTLRKDDKDRIVCKQIAQTGSRLRPVTECLTVGQREQRALATRQIVDKIQTENCIVGEGQACGN